MKKGWETKRLGDLIELISGQHIDSKDYNTTGRGVGYLTGPSDFGPVFPVVTKWTEHPKIKAKKNDILITVKGSGVGKVNLLDADEVAISRQLMAIRVVNAERQFVYLFLESTFDHFQVESTGAAIPGISREQVLGLSIAVPPLAEQQRIVGVLDQAFAGLATAQANAARNLQNSRALFESHVQSVFTNRGKGWVEKTLGETCEMYQPKTIGTKDLVTDGPYPVFGANGIIGRYDKFNHEEPQLLVTCRGATCGAVNISEPKSWITGNAMVVRPLDESLELSFLEYAFRGGIDISKAITGAAQPQITRTNLSPLVICFPKPVTEQRLLASTFRALAAETQRLTRLYEQKQAALIALKKSLLYQAFSGAL